MAKRFKTPTRDQIGTFAGNHELVRFIELLSANAGDLIPIELEQLFLLVQEASLDASLANSKAVAVLDQLEQTLGELAANEATTEAKLNAVSDVLNRFIKANELNTGDEKANSVADEVAYLKKQIEVAVTRPGFEMPNTFPVDYIDFNLNPSYFGTTRRVAWNPTDDTLNVHHSDGVTQQVGQELYGRITNNTGSLIPNGSCLGVNPATNSYVLFIADGTLTPLTIIGVTTQDIPNGAQGRVTVWGQVRDIDTTGTPYGEVWVAGQILYVSPTIAGGFTNAKPTAPNLSMPIAQVLFVDATLGRIAVRPTIEQQLFYGQFIKTSDQVPTAANTANAITWDSTIIANGISIGAPTSRIVATNAGLYTFRASFQLTSSSASVKNVWFWFRKNGTDVTNSSLITSMDSATAIRTPSRSQFFSLAAGDYIEVYWASDSTAVTLDNIAATAFAPAAPAALLSVTQEQQ